MSIAHFVDDHFGKLVAGSIAIVAAGLGLAIYADATAERFSLRKDEWTCTDKRTEQVAMLRMQPAGNGIVVPITDYIDQETCHRYERKASQ